MSGLQPADTALSEKKRGAQRGAWAVTRSLGSLQLARGGGTIVEVTVEPEGVEPEPVITWGTGPAIALTFTVNFGVFAGRDVSRRELERLGEVLLLVVEGVSLTTEHRFEFGRHSAVDLHQVRVEIDYDALPPDEADIEALRGRIAEALEEWLRACLTGIRVQELTHAEIVARDAVVEGMLGEPGPPPSP